MSLIEEGCHSCFVYVTRSKGVFRAKVDFAIITPKVGVVSFGKFQLSTQGDSRITYVAASVNASAMRT